MLRNTAAPTIIPLRFIFNYLWLQSSVKVTYNYRNNGAAIRTYHCSSLPVHTPATLSATFGAIFVAEPLIILVPATFSVVFVAEQRGDVD